MQNVSVSWRSGNTLSARSGSYDTYVELERREERGREFKYTSGLSQLQSFLVLR